MKKLIIIIMLIICCAFVFAADKKMFVNLNMNENNITNITRLCNSTSCITYEQLTNFTSTLPWASITSKPFNSVDTTDYFTILAGVLGFNTSYLNQSILSVSSVYNETGLINAVNLSSLKNIVEDTTPELGGNLNANNKNITNVSSINDIIFSNGSVYMNNNLTVSGEISGSQNWTDNQNYPAACPSDSFVTQNGDSNICSEVYNVPNGNEANFTNIKIKNNPSENGGLSGNRSLTTSNDVVVTVCNSGCDYDIIQEALNDVPYELRHTYKIEVKEGNYDEDLKVPNTIGVRDTSTEGVYGGLYLLGSGSSNTTINSILVYRSEGVWNPIIGHFEVDSIEPTSDENVSISLYNVEAALISDINFTADVSSGILSYSSGNYIYNSWFNGQRRGVNQKRGGWTQFGDNFNNQSNKGNTIEELVSCTDGIISINSNNDVTSPVITDCDTKKEGIILYNGLLQCVGLNNPEPIDGTLTVNDNININGINNNYQLYLEGRARFGDLVLSNIENISTSEIPAIYGNITNIEKRELYVGIQDNSEFYNGIHIIENNSGRSGEKIEFFLGSNSRTQIIDNGDIITNGYINASGDINNVGNYIYSNGLMLSRFGINNFSTDSTESEIYTSGQDGLYYPFTSLGNLIIQPRTSLNKDIIFATRKNDTENNMVMVVKGDNPRVGINTVSPTEELDVNGSAIISENLTIQELAAPPGQTCTLIIDENGLISQGACS